MRNSGFVPGNSDFRVNIRPPDEADEDDFVAAMQASKAFHHPWLTAPSDGPAFQRYLRHFAAESEASFLVLRLADNAICGVINLNVITYGALQSAYMSYYAVAAMASRGYMKEGMQLVIHHAFTVLGLHRLEANVQPGNKPSIEFIRTLGFRREGFSPRYLKISGEWRDHERWALLNDDTV
jgi:ribosomal-protein-alanine N-acetyltransferase